MPLNSESNSKKILIVDGDVTIDWNLASTRRSDGSAMVWNADDCSRVYQQRGGAALIADLLELVAERINSQWQVSGPVVADEWVRPNDNQYHHSYAMWSVFEYDARAAGKGQKAPKSWRVQQFLGLDRRTSRGTSEGERKRVQDITDANIVVLDDADLGFRDDPALWPKAIDSNRHPWVVLKMSRPVAQGRLWEHLHRNCADRLIVVMSVNDLRLTEVQISRELSWERTAQDLAWELVHNPRINALSRCAHVVISFDTAGAFLLTGKRVAPKCKLFFDPAVIEGMWCQNHQGGMIGYTSCLTAGIVRHLMMLPESPCVEDGIQKGLAAMRKLHLEGYGLRGSNAAEAMLAFPTELISTELGSGTNNFSVAEVQDPLIYVSGSSPVSEIPAGLPRSQPGFWTILEDRYSEGLGRVAEQIVEKGAESILIDVPLGKFGALLTVDRREIESFRSIRALTSEYIGKQRQKRPLSIAVFGAPGSGKSFGIVQVAESLRPGEIKVLEFNLSQFTDQHELLDALHQVRDAGLSGQIPLVFWDEFDTTLEGQPFGWLRHFLAPMQDGRFQQGQISHPIGRSIFVFAGGISETMDLFGADMSPREFRDVKGPDFISRLKGYVNILGPNPQKNSFDRYHIIRRAILLRSILRRDAAQIFEKSGSEETLNMDSGVLRAMLNTSLYKHGVRSMESVIAMSQLTGKHRFERSCLPPIEQLDLHVDARDFQALVQQIELEGELLEKLAQATHEVFVNRLRDQGYVPGSHNDEEQKTHTALRAYDELPDDEKEQNRDNVRDMSNKLASAGYVMVPARSNEPPFDFPGADLELLASMEHDRWMKSKIDSGWRWAPTTDKARHLHKDLLPWRKLSDEQRAGLSTCEAGAIGPDELSEQAREKDRLLVKAIPKILAQAGYTVIKRGGAREPTAND